MSLLKSKSLGFSVIELLLVMVVLGFLVLGGIYVWRANQKSETATNSNSSQTSTQAPSSATTPTAYQRTTTVPSDWKTYANADYHISFSYPSNWNVTPNSKGNPDNCDYEIGMGPSAQTYIGLICINRQSIADNIAPLKKSYSVISDTALTIDSHQAEVVRYHNGDNIERQYFISAFGYTYTPPPVLEQDYPAGSAMMSAQDSLILFDSIRIN